MKTSLKDDDKLDRYMSFNRLLDCFVNKRFVFPKYIRFKDPWEGFFHEARLKHDDYQDETVLGKHYPFIMCFTNHKESDAMWHTYSKNTTRVKIVTSVSKLKKLVNKPSSGFDSYLRTIEYLSKSNIENADFLIKRFPGVFKKGDRLASWEHAIIDCLFIKRDAFKHEDEVRLLLYFKEKQKDDFYHLYTDPNEIIERVVLDPRIKKELEELYRDSLIKLGYKNFDGDKGIVVKSDLYKPKKYYYNLE